jgi:hypothetical protein
MSMNKETPQGDSFSIPVEHMPPLNVTTEGIPAQEHVREAGLPPAERRDRVAAWTIVIASLLVVVATVTLLVASGLTAAPAAGFQYSPSGERGYAAVWHVSHVR